MNTRVKNKSAHPGVPDMSASQLSAAGLSRTSGKRKMTKDQQIMALKDELRAAKEAISSVSPPSLT